MCLAARVEGIWGVGVERDPELAALAEKNAGSNGFPIAYMAGSVEALPLRGPFDHAFANPPFHPASGTPSAVAARNTAKRAHGGLFADWAMALAAALRRRGTLTFILPASALAACLAGLAEADCGSIALFPLWASDRKPAKLVLLRGVKGGKGPCRVLAGLTLHDHDGRFTPEAESVLRHGSGLAF
jgi:tRNA1(Val) A37 N6-methylase TrmN6